MADLNDIIWQNCYDFSWKGDIVPEAFSHPAKFSRGLIYRIYQHAKEMGWFKPGDYVLDPFGGVALGGLDAMSMGLNWIGVELEEKFVTLGQQNIELWNCEFKGWPNLGTARIVQGDSRRLRDVIKEASLIVSSPPFSSTVAVQDNKFYQKCLVQIKRNPEGASVKGHIDYGHTPGNLANMKEGDIDLICSSPPYADSVNSGRDGIDFTKSERPRPDKMVPHDSYHYPLGKAAPSDFKYGSSEGQLGSMKEGSFDMCVSSPPYEDIVKTGEGTGATTKNRPNPRASSQAYYSKSDNNLGNSSGDTFWQASKEILSQCYDLLKPNGMSIWVCKDYVKKGKRVPFSDRWLALCESVGFTLICRHQAMLVREHGTQMTSYGDEKITTERKSFFRRLAESKGSPRIDWEDVICVIK